MKHPKPYNQRQCSWQIKRLPIRKNKNTPFIRIHHARNVCRGSADSLVSVHQPKFSILDCTDPATEEPGGKIIFTGFETWIYRRTVTLPDTYLLDYGRPGPLWRSEYCHEYHPLRSFLSLSLFVPRDFFFSDIIIHF